MNPVFNLDTVDTVYIVGIVCTMGTVDTVVVLGRATVEIHTSVIVI